MAYKADQPLIVQNDFTVLLEVHHPRFEAIRGYLHKFAELIKNPEHVHTYRITPLSLWNAASSGLKANEIMLFLRMNIKYQIPVNVLEHIQLVLSRYGQVRLEKREDRLLLVCDDMETCEQLWSAPLLRPYWAGPPSERAVPIVPGSRGLIKLELIRLGYPVIDLAGYDSGESLQVRFRTNTLSGKPFTLRNYQREAIESFYREGSVYGGNGVLVLPCGAGKTVIGIGAMTLVNSATLILTSNATSVQQWKREILDKTELTQDQIGEYSSGSKQVRPVTITTYQMLTHRKSKEADFTHMKLFQERDWGLIIYDEVHLLPAPVFRATADIQATRRLGLTATLVREDGRAEDVFSLVGPKRFDKPWKELEQDGWISKVECTEVRVPLPPGVFKSYAASAAKQQFRIAGENPAKLEVLQRLIRKHKGQPTLVIGQYLGQLSHIAQQLNAPMICGRMPHEDRNALYDRFKKGEVSLLVVSKVANFAVDLPDAAVAVQVSGSFGSRQEEAQRLGRLLRPKQAGNQAYFYSLVTSDSREQQYADHRQMFLTEQGYSYRVADPDSVVDGKEEVHI